MDKYYNYERSSDDVDELYLFDWAGMKEMNYVDMARKCVEQTENFRFNLPASEVLLKDNVRIQTNGWFDTHEEWRTIVKYYHAFKNFSWQLGPAKPKYEKYTDRNNLTYTMLIEESDTTVYDLFEFAEVLTQEEKEFLGAYNLMSLNAFISHPQYAERRGRTSWRAVEEAIEEYENTYPTRKALDNMREVGKIKWIYPVVQPPSSLENSEVKREEGKLQHTKIKSIMKKTTIKPYDQQILHKEDAKNPKNHLKMSAPKISNPDMKRLRDQRKERMFWERAGKITNKSQHDLEKLCELADIEMQFDKDSKNDYAKYGRVRTKKQDRPNELKDESDWLRREELPLEEEICPIAERIETIKDAKRRADEFQECWSLTNKQAVFNDWRGAFRAFREFKLYPPLHCELRVYKNITEDNIDENYRPEKDWKGKKAEKPHTPERSYSSAAGMIKELGIKTPGDFMDIMTGLNERRVGRVRRRPYLTYEERKCLENENEPWQEVKGSRRGKKPVKESSSEQFSQEIEKSQPSETILNITNNNRTSRKQKTEAAEHHFASNDIRYINQPYEEKGSETKVKLSKEWQRVRSIKIKNWSEVCKLGVRVVESKIQERICMPKYTNEQVEDWYYSSEVKEWYDVLDERRLRGERSAGPWERKACFFYRELRKGKGVKEALDELGIKYKKPDKWVVTWFIGGKEWLGEGKKSTGKPNKAEINKLAKNRKPRDRMGITNYGKFCYAIAATQMLVAMSDKKAAKNKKEDCKVAELIRRYRFGTQEEVLSQIKDICSTLNKSLKTKYDEQDPEDAREFMRNVLKITEDKDELFSNTVIILDSPKAEWEGRYPLLPVKDAGKKDLEEQIEDQYEDLIVRVSENLLIETEWGKEQRPEVQKELMIRNFGNEVYKLDLEAICIHTGDKENGHYYTIRQDEERKAFWKLDDGKVTAIGEKELSKILKDISQTPVMIIYRNKGLMPNDEEDNEETSETKVVGEQRVVHREKITVGKEGNENSNTEKTENDSEEWVTVYTGVHFEKVLEDKSKSTPRKGLDNWNGTCYALAAIQVLVHIGKKWIEGNTKNDVIGDILRSYRDETPLEVTEKIKNLCELLNENLICPSGIKRTYGQTRGSSNQFMLDCLFLRSRENKNQGITTLIQIQDENVPWEVKPVDAVPVIMNPDERTCYRTLQEWIDGKEKYTIEQDAKKFEMTSISGTIIFSVAKSGKGTKIEEWLDIRSGTNDQKIRSISYVLMAAVYHVEPDHLVAIRRECQYGDFHLYDNGKVTHLSKDEYEKNWLEKETAVVAVYDESEIHWPTRKKGKDKKKKKLNDGDQPEELTKPETKIITPWTREESARFRRLRNGRPYEGRISTLRKGEGEDAASTEVIEITTDDEPMEEIKPVKTCINTVTVGTYAGKEGTELIWRCGLNNWNNTSYALAAIQVLVHMRKHWVYSFSSVKDVLDKYGKGTRWSMTDEVKELCRILNNFTANQIKWNNLDEEPRGYGNGTGNSANQFIMDCMMLHFNGCDGWLAVEVDLELEEDNGERKEMKNVLAVPVLPEAESIQGWLDDPNRRSSHQDNPKTKILKAQETIIFDIAESENGMCIEEWIEIPGIKTQTNKVSRLGEEVYVLMAAIYRTAPDHWVTIRREWQNGEFHVYDDDKVEKLSKENFERDWRHRKTATLAVYDLSEIHWPRRGTKNPQNTTGRKATNKWSPEGCKADRQYEERWVTDRLMCFAVGRPKKTVKRNMDKTMVEKLKNRWNQERKEEEDATKVYEKVVIPGVTEEEPRKPQAKRDRDRKLKKLNRILKSLLSPQNIFSRPKEAQRAEVELAEAVKIQPYSHEDVRVILSGKKTELHFFDECVSPNNDWTIEQGTIFPKGAILRIINFINEPVNLLKGQKVGTARKIDLAGYPELENITEAGLDEEELKKKTKELADDARKFDAGLSPKEIIEQKAPGHKDASKILEHAICPEKGPYFTRPKDVESHKEALREPKIKIEVREDTQIPTIKAYPTGSKKHWKKIMAINEKYQQEKIKDGCSKVERKENQEKLEEEEVIELPSVKSKHLFEEKLKEMPEAMRVAIIPHENLFIAEDPGEEFQYSTIEPQAYDVREDAPSMIKTPYTKNYTPEEMRALNKWLEEKIAAKMVRKSDTLITSPALTIPKQNSDKIRIVIDVREVNNKCLRPVNRPMPVAEDCWRKYAHMNYFATIDVTSAYHRIKLIKEHRKYTGFEIPYGPHKGIYEYESLGQGISQSGAKFMKVMEELLRGLPGATLDGQREEGICCVYIDDIIIASATLEDHIRDVKWVLGRLQFAKLKLDISKSFFCKFQVEFLGLLIGNSIIRTNPERTKSLDMLKVPELGRLAIKPWQEFEGIIQYYRKFIPDVSKHLSTIKRLNVECIGEKDQQIVREKQQKCERIKEKMISGIKDQVLYAPPPNTRLVLKTDASDHSVGFVLECAENRRPIQFGGKVLSQLEIKRTIFEKEMLAVSHAVRKAEPYLKRCKSVRIMSDNLAAVLNYSHNGPITVSQRAIKDLLDITTRLGGIEHSFDHVSGIVNVIADFISRVDTKTAKEVTERTKITWIETGTMTRSKRRIFDALKDLHKKGAHAGVERLVNLAKEQGIDMKGNTKLADKVLDECEFCRVEKKILAETAIGMTETPTRELSLLHCDHIEMPMSRTGNDHILTVIDVFSKFLWAIPVKLKNMETAIPILRTIVTEHESIKKITADNAFDTYAFNSLFSKKGITVKFTSSHSSRQNSVERAHRTVKECLAKYMKQNNVDYDNWEQSLDEATIGYNKVPHSSTGYSPTYIALNKLPEILIDEPENRKMLSKRRLREKVAVRLREDKMKYVKLAQKLPKLKKGAKVWAHYDHVQEPFEVEIIEDQGIVVKAKRTNYTGRYKTLRFSKRHLYKMKHTDIEEQEGFNRNDLVMRNKVSFIQYSDLVEGKNFLEEGPHSDSTIVEFTGSYVWTRFVESYQQVWAAIFQIFTFYMLIKISANMPGLSSHN